MKRREIEIIEYLSGEMGVEERGLFESRMEADSALKSEVQALQSTNAALSSWNNEDIRIPDYTPNLSGLDGQRNANRIWNLSHSWVKYAAIIPLLIGLLWVSGFQIQSKDNALIISIGDPTSENMDAKISAAIENALVKYNSVQSNEITSEIQALRKEVIGIENNLNQISNDWKRKNEASINSIAQLTNNRYQSLIGLIEEYRNSQQNQMDESFAALVDYLETKRTDDLFQIENAFSEIVVALGNQQERTNEMFESLVQPVATNY